MLRVVCSSASPSPTWEGGWFDGVHDHHSKGQQKVQVVIMDLNFQPQTASNPSQSWSKVDPNMYSQCFLGMARNSEGWCQQCQSLDHTTDSCPSQHSLPCKSPWHPSPHYQSLEHLLVLSQYAYYIISMMVTASLVRMFEARGSHSARHCSTQQPAEDKGYQQPWLTESQILDCL